MVPKASVANPPSTDSTCRVVDCKPRRDTTATAPFNGQSATGTLKQAGQTFPLNLKRLTDGNRSRLAEDQDGALVFLGLAFSLPPF